MPYRYEVEDHGGLHPPPPPGAGPDLAIVVSGRQIVASVTHVPMVLSAATSRLLSPAGAHGARKLALADLNQTERAADSQWPASRVMAWTDGDGKEVVHVRYKPRWGQVGLVHVEPAHRRFGLATAALAVVERRLEAPRIFAACTRTHYFWSRLPGYVWCEPPVHPPGVTGGGFAKEIDRQNNNSSS